MNEWQLTPCLGVAMFSVASFFETLFFSILNFLNVPVVPGSKGFVRFVPSMPEPLRSSVPCQQPFPVWHEISMEQSHATFWEAKMWFFALVSRKMETRVILVH